MVVSLHYCSQNGGNLYRAPYYNGNPNTGLRMIGNLDQSPCQNHNTQETRGKLLRLRSKLRRSLSSLRLPCQISPPGNEDFWTLLKFGVQGIFWENFKMGAYSRAEVDASPKRWKPRKFPAYSLPSKSV